MSSELNSAQILQLLNSQLKLDRLMPALLDIVLELTAAERGFLMLYDSEGKLVTQSSRNSEKQDLNEETFQGSSSIVKKVADEKEALYIPSLPSNQDFGKTASVRAANLQSVICVPLFRPHQDSLLGILYIDSSASMRGLLKQEHLQLVQGLANHVAISIENAKLFAEVNEKGKEIEGLNRLLKKQVDQQAGKLVEMEILLEGTQRELGKRYGLGNLIGKSPAMQKVFSVLEKVVSTSATVLIQGESGTGKELVARYLHHHGPRSGKPMVSINCASFNDTLLESELFGHRKGAYTGADQNKTGLFQVANGGTLFLDEVGDMSLEMQKKLLRVLQSGEVRPVGSEDVFHVDVRIIAASNKNLRDLIQQSKFREDLFFRLNVIQVQLPPLRERYEDLQLLIDHFTKQISDELKRPLKPVSPKALEKFMEHSWPGNVRELENELRRYFILDSEYQFEQTPAVSAPENSLNLNVLEKNAILKAMDSAQGNKTKAAELLGLPLRTFYDRLKKYDL
jgi:transcriptional regulator with GAF, ATPase, and Fis domain